MPALVPVAAPAAVSQPSAVAPAALTATATRASVPARADIAAGAPNIGIKVAQAETSQPAPTASEPAPLKSADVAPVQIHPVQMQPAQIEPAPIETHTAAAAMQTVPAAYSAPPARSHAGWLIQIGAFDDEDQAKQHLSAAQIKVHAPLAAKDPFTERVQKGDKALYRARFAGFDKSTAEAACRALKRSDFECMALKD
jgi:D-alanyl-D-alanine carboxypeptidase